ncbi:MAG: ABC transporter permease [Candidatus Riflebacteria bacterium]|nr:ABC transporter permease [Candidatus Riflebacteria bacterium]
MTKFAEFLRNMTMAGKFAFLGIVIVILLGILAPAIAPHSPHDQDITRKFKKVDGYPLGCDELGRCVLSRLLYGARLSLTIALFARLLAILVGVAVGLTAGYFGGAIDWTLMRLADIFLAFPSLLLAIAISMVMDSSVQTVIFAIAASGWAEIAKITRASAMELKTKEYVTVAKTFGAGDFRIIMTHILPNAMPVITVVFTMGIASAVLTEASLSYLGMGVPPELPTWGGMVNAGKDYLIAYPAAVFYPGLAIAFLVIVFNLFGDELRDAMDPARRVNL